MKYYAGIGSRETPKDVLFWMVKLARRLAAEGWTLRSGGAEGADGSFQCGAVLASGPHEIFTADDATPQAIAHAEQYHGKILETFGNPASSARGGKTNGDFSRILTLRTLECEHDSESIPISFLPNCRTEKSVAANVGLYPSCL